MTTRIEPDIKLKRCGGQGRRPSHLSVQEEMSQKKNGMAKRKKEAPKMVLTALKRLLLSTRPHLTRRSTREGTSNHL